MEDDIQKTIARAKQGDAEAEYDIGRMYYKGEGLWQDYEKAAKWFKKAAEQGHARALGALGRMYEKGDGVEQDKQEAAKWYRLSATQGYVKAQEVAIKWYAKALMVLTLHPRKVLFWLAVIIILAVVCSVYFDDYYPRSYLDRFDERRF